MGVGDSDPHHGATITGVYWGRSLRSLTGGGAKAPNWGAREAEGSGNSEGGQGAS